MKIPITMPITEPIIFPLLILISLLSLIKYFGTKGRMIDTNNAKAAITQQIINI